MAIRLSFDVIGSTCGDLLRFADAVRAAGIRPESPLQQSGPNRIDVVDDNGAATGPPMPPFAPHRPGPHQLGPFVEAGPGFAMSGSFPPGPPGFHSTAPRHMRSLGAFIAVNWGNRSREQQFPLDAVDRWRAALDAALGSAALDEPARAALHELREAFNDQETPGGS
ncbi:hypothetical protein GCM10009557_61320 [Virgisporangium ochraceum]|uniref:Uncharacterized protein n=1 Tax=Virgisporangium ochraceum TaxID=65505 RepID=A0A8J3ZR34_9ACTN|nr:hypothetical protein [Virgisporangium ochraceum]GIJ65991.1 hypothetical protein Voc01_009080 [Virgisporangium ochraceum]